jgi:hypothetical protein
VESAIMEIQETNKKLVDDVLEGNRKISEIVELVKEIGNKTKVINDIVFQTKLLSFNASVEAARAGEHGKGFAVVAEEVGNLASMSGQASKEISALLENLNTDSTQFNKIASPTSTGYELEKISNIVYCEGMDNYSKIITLQGREITVTKTLKYLEETLPNTVFFRIHKSTLINLNYISNYSRVDGYSVTMTTGKKLDVSVRKSEQLVSFIYKNRTV